jgi:hypothetical protein
VASHMRSVGEASARKISLKITREKESYRALSALSGAVVDSSMTKPHGVRAAMAKARPAY